MNPATGLDLSRPRDLGALVSDALSLYLRNFGTFLTIAATVVIPVQLVVNGIGLEQITAAYDEEPELAEQLVPVVVAYLVTAPLLAGMTIHALLQAAAGEQPSARRSIEAGLDAFAPIFLAVVLAASGIALGLLAFIVPGVYLGVRWYFVAQAVVIDRRRGPGALARSGELVSGQWWRTFGIVLVFALLAELASAIVGLPLAVAAAEANRAVLALAGSILAQLVAGPFVAVAGTLLFFDLSARRAGRAPEPVRPGPPPREGPPDPPGLPPRD